MNNVTYFGIGQAQVEALGWLLGAAVVLALIAVVGGCSLVLLISVLRHDRVEHAAHRRRLAVAVLGEDESDDDQDDEEADTELPEPVLATHDRSSAHDDPAAQFRVSLAPLNSLQVASIRDLVRRAKQAHTIDVCIRKDGVERRFEADWLKHITEPSAEERESQRRSFVYGNTKLDFPAVTREMVDQEADACEAGYAPGSFPMGVTGQGADEPAPRARPDYQPRAFAPGEEHGIQTAYDAYAAHENELNRRADAAQQHPENARRDAKRPPPYIE